MRTKSLVIAPLLAAAIAAAAAPARAQSEQPPAGADPSMMEQMMAMTRPGDEHKHLTDMVGTWKTRQRMWMEPGAPPMESEGACVYTAILGGRYVQGSFKGDMMGMPFEGFSIDGFDRYKQQYFSIWLDSMGTGYFISSGSASPDGKTYTHTGSMFDPMKNSDCAVRSVTNVVDKNTVKFTMYRTDGGQEIKVMEIDYLRQ